MGKLGQLLVARSWITVQQLTRALQNQNAVGGRLGTCLLEMEVVGEDLLVRSLSEQQGVPAAGIEELRGIPDEVLRLIPEKLARRCRAIPFRVAGGRLDVAMQDPRNLVCQDEIAFACGKRVKVHVLHELRIYEALQRYYREDTPSRYSLLLDRLNRARYLWSSSGSLPAPGALTVAQRAEVLSALPSDGLLGDAPNMAPPPLPEPSLPPTPRRRSLFGSRPTPTKAAAPVSTPPAPAAPPAPPAPEPMRAAVQPAGPGPGALNSERPKRTTKLPPLEDLELRTTPAGPLRPRPAAPDAVSPGTGLAAATGTASLAPPGTATAAARTATAASPATPATGTAAIPPRRTVPGLPTAPPFGGPAAHAAGASGEAAATARGRGREHDKTERTDLSGVTAWVPPADPLAAAGGARPPAGATDDDSRQWAATVTADFRAAREVANRIAAAPETGGSFVPGTRLADWTGGAVPEVPAAASADALLARARPAVGNEVFVPLARDAGAGAGGFTADPEARRGAGLAEDAPHDGAQTPGRRARRSEDTLTQRLDLTAVESGLLAAAQQRTSPPPAAGTGLASPAGSPSSPATAGGIPEGMLPPSSPTSVAQGTKSGAGKTISDPARWAELAALLDAPAARPAQSVGETGASLPPSSAAAAPPDDTGGAGSTDDSLTTSNRYDKTTKLDLAWVASAVAAHAAAAPPAEIAADATPAPSPATAPTGAEAAASGDADEASEASDAAAGFTGASNLRWRPAAADAAAGAAWPPASDDADAGTDADRLAAEYSRTTKIGTLDPATLAASTAAPADAAPGSDAPTREAVDLETTIVLGPPRRRPSRGGMAPMSPGGADRAPSLDLRTSAVDLAAVHGSSAAAPAGPASSGADAPPVRSAPATIEEVERAFAETTDREEVGRILLGFLAHGFRRVALFQVARLQVTAWMAHGDDIDQEAFGHYTASFTQPSIFLNLRQGNGIHMGPLPPMAAHRELALCWGGGLPRDCIMLPVRMRDRLVIVAYVDGGSRGLAGIDFEQMQRLTAATAVAFERCILNKKRGYAQS